MNPDTIGCMWTGEFDLNTLHVDGEIFESGKKKLRIQKFPDTCVCRYTAFINLGIKTTQTNTNLEELSSVIFFEVKIVHPVVWPSDALATK